MHKILIVSKSESCRKFRCTPKTNSAQSCAYSEICIVHPCKEPVYPSLKMAIYLIYIRIQA
jgi:hypothetical protein